MFENARRNHDDLAASPYDYDLLVPTGTDHQRFCLLRHLQIQSFILANPIGIYMRIRKLWILERDSTSLNFHIRKILEFFITIMAPTRSKKRKSNESQTSVDATSFLAPVEHTAIAKSQTTSRTPISRSPIKKAARGITVNQKQALIDNLQLESKHRTPRQNRIFKIILKLISSH